MTRIRGEVVIAAPVEEVFDTVADERNEPAYNPRIVRVEKLGAGPVGPGTTFLVEPRTGPGARADRAGRAEMRVQLVEHEPPRRLRTRVTSSSMAVDGVLTFTPVPGGTRFRWDWDLRLLGPVRLLSPVVRLVGPRWERRNWLGLKAYLERRRSDPSDAGAADGDPDVLEVHLEELGHQDLDDPREPNGWVEDARRQLEELEQELAGRGWHRSGGTGRHWWSRSYVRARRR